MSLHDEFGDVTVADLWKKTGNVFIHGFEKLIDSELGNPLPPAPRVTNPSAEAQVITTDTGKGTVSVKKGVLPYFGSMTTSMKIAFGVGAAVVGFYLIKKVF